MTWQRHLLGRAACDIHELHKPVVPSFTANPYIRIFAGVHARLRVCAASQTYRHLTPHAAEVCAALTAHSLLIRMCHVPHLKTFESRGEVMLDNVFQS